MISRRQILQSGLAATSLPLVAGLSFAPLASAQARALEHPALYKVLFDQRFAASREFGREALWQGQSVQAFNGDITNVWYHDLHPRWKHGPAAIAGFTAHGALFCLERLAWDVGMRVTHRAEQRFEGHEPLYSWVIAPRV
jgi:predicted methyltransferase